MEVIILNYNNKIITVTILETFLCAYMALMFKISPSHLILTKKCIIMIANTLYSHLYATLSSLLTHLISTRTLGGDSVCIPILKMRKVCNCQWLNDQ